MLAGLGGEGIAQGKGGGGGEGEPLSLSLSVTHTFIHTHTHTRMAHMHTLEVRHPRHSNPAQFPAPSVGMAPKKADPSLENDTPWSAGAEWVGGDWGRILTKVHNNTLFSGRV